MENFSEYFLLYWHYWLLELLALVAVVVFVLANWKKIIRLTTSHMLALAVVIWIAGVGLYCIGFAYEGSAGSLTSFLLRAAQASLGMFLSENELIEVSPVYKESTIYMVIFSLIHAAAIFLSAIFILNTIGFRLKNYILIHNFVRESAAKDEVTHFFWGLTDESFSMAEDIRSRYPSDRIVFMRLNAEANMGERLEVLQILGSSSSLRHSLNLRRKIESVDDAMVFYVPDTKPWIQTRTMRKILRNTSTMNFYAFTADEKLNLKLGGEIFNDPELSSATDKSITVSSLATRGGKNRIVEDHISLRSSEGCRIRWNLIDRPYLSVRALRLNASLHPVCSIPDGAVANGAVDGKFTAIIIGFGRTGQQMFNHLYEFSSFIGRDGKPVQKRFLVVDPDINRKAGQICISNPSFFHTDTVKTLSTEIGSVEFWRGLREYAGEANCISIALDDDEKNTDMAMDIFRAELQYRVAKPHNMKVYMQLCSSDNYADIKTLETNYNRVKVETGIELITFGGIRDTFNCDVVMAKDVLKRARVFNYNFDLLRGINADCTPEEAWKRDYSLKKFMDRFRFAPLALEMYYSSINQCNADCSHIGTLMKLAGVSPDDVDTLAGYVELIRQRDIKSTKYPGAGKDFQKLMENLAKCAHNRLVTSNWLFGFRPGDVATVEASPVEAARQKITAYMIPWEKCDEVTRLLAYTVVDTSFIIALHDARERAGITE